MSIKKSLRICVEGIGEIPTSQLKQNRLELFRKKKLTECSKRKGFTVKTSTVNMNVINLRVLLNKAVEHVKIDSKLIGGIKLLEENNISERLLIQDQCESLYLHGPLSLK